MTTEIPIEVPALVPFLKREGGRPFLLGSRCGECDEIFVGAREICAKCAARDKMQTVRLAETGTLYNHTLIHRSFPGVKTPFIDAIVDLDDGSHLKGTLVDIEPEDVSFDLKVKVVYREAIPVNADGKSYLSYFFVPVSE